MDNDKNTGLEGQAPVKEGEGDKGHAPRARNRTVMLTPEVTGQVRARLAQDIDSGHSSPSEQKPFGNYQAPDSSGSDSGFVSVASRNRNSSFDGGADPRGARPSPIPLPPLAQPVTHAAPVISDSKSGAIWSKRTPVVGFLVSFDVDPNGEIFELRSGRVIVTSEVSGQGNFFLVRDETVSPMHAILRISASGEVQVLDQLSEHGTKVKRFGGDEEKELSGEKGSLEHGDVVRFGKRNFHVCMVQLAQGA